MDLGITLSGASSSVSDGTFEAAPQLYIDTSSLQEHLLSIHTQATQDDAKFVESAEESKHVPIFLFSLGGKMPVFVDKYYQSVALSNMIVGVQSNFKEWESHMACNSKPVYPC